MNPMVIKAIAVLVLIAALATCVILYGNSRYDECKAEWDAHEAAEKAVADTEAAAAAVVLKRIKEQHDEDVKRVASEAGRAAIADYLRKHGVLSDSPKVPARVSATYCPEAKSNPCDDAASSEPRVSGSDTLVEEFAARCAADALMLEDEWQAMAISDGWEIVE